MVKNTQCRRLGSSLGQEDPLEKGMATHSSILAWVIPWTEEPTVHGVEELDMTEHDKACIYTCLYTHTHTYTQSQGNPKFY